jgi:hypothetical protein
VIINAEIVLINLLIVRNVLILLDHKYMTVFVRMVGIMMVLMLLV